MTSGEPGQCGVSRSILLVDDDPKVLACIRRLLRPLSARVLEARSGKEALAVLEVESPAIVVSDYEMPEMNGEQLIAVIRSTRPLIRCVLHSGAWSLPALGPQVPVLAKPCSPDTFLSLLRSLLAESKGFSTCT